MRKLHSLIGAVVAVIVMSSAALAIDQKSVLVNATVDPYVVLTVTAQPMAFGTFSGAPDDERTRDNAGFSIETNTALDLTFSAGDLKGGVSQLDTKYEAIKNSSGNSLGHFNRDDIYTPKGDLTALNAQAAKTIESYHVNGTARTGAISSQEAGDYSATITVTASVH